MGAWAQLTSAARSAWRPTAILALASAVAALAAFAHTTPSFAWDRAIAEALLGLSSPVYDAFMTGVSLPGQRTGVYATLLGGAALATWRLGWRAGVLVLSALLLMGANEVFKDVVDRPRPLEPPAGGGESYPSGHVLHAMLTSGLLWLLAAPRIGSAAWRRGLGAALTAWPLLVGISRVHLERHWPSDVLGSYLLGTALLVAMAWVWQRAAPADDPPEQAAAAAGEEQP